VTAVAAAWASLVHQADGRNRGGHPGEVGQRIGRLSDQVQAVCAENRECLSGRNRFDPDGARLGGGLSGVCELVVSSQQHRDHRPRRQAMARVGVEVGGPSTGVPELARAAPQEPAEAGRGRRA
jgi:hypothetical protein